MDLAPPAILSQPGSLIGLGSGDGSGRQRSWEHAAPPVGPGEGQTVARDQDGGWV